MNHKNAQTNTVSIFQTSYYIVITVKTGTSPENIQYKWSSRPRRRTQFLSSRCPGGRGQSSRKTSSLLFNRCPFRCV